MVADVQKGNSNGSFRVQIPLPVIPRYDGLPITSAVPQRTANRLISKVAAVIFMSFLLPAKLEGKLRLPIGDWPLVQAVRLPGDRPR